MRVPPAPPRQPHPRFAGLQRSDGVPISSDVRIDEFAGTSRSSEQFGAPRRRDGFAPSDSYGRRDGLASAIRLSEERRGNDPLRQGAPLPGLEVGYLISLPPAYCGQVREMATAGTLFITEATIFSSWLWMTRGWLQTSIFKNEKDPGRGPREERLSLGWGGELPLPGPRPKQEPRRPLPVKDSKTSVSPVVGALSFELTGGQRDSLMRPCCC